MKVKYLVTIIATLTSLFALSFLLNTPITQAKSDRIILHKNNTNIQISNPEALKEADKISKEMEDKNFAVEVQQALTKSGYKFSNLVTQSWPKKQVEIEMTAVQNKSEVIKNIASVVNTIAAENDLGEVGTKIRFH